MPAEEDDAVSALSELEVRGVAGRAGSGRGGGGAGQTPLFVPTHNFMGSAGTA